MDNSGQNVNGIAIAVFPSFIISMFLALGAMWIASEFNVSQAGLLIVLCVSFLVCFFGLIWLMNTETMKEANIKAHKDALAKQAAKDAQKAMFKQDFDVTDGSSKVGSLSVRGDKIELTYMAGTTTSFDIKDIRRIELLQAQEVHAAHGITGGVVGGLVAGPLGAAAGASMGRLLRECVFTVQFGNGTTVACKSIHKLYKDFETYYKIKSSSIA